MVQDHQWASRVDRLTPTMVWASRRMESTVDHMAMRLDATTQVCSSPTLSSFLLLPLSPLFILSVFPSLYPIWSPVYPDSSWLSSGYPEEAGVLSSHVKLLLYSSSLTSFLLLSSVTLPLPASHAPMAMNLDVTILCAYLFLISVPLLLCFHWPWLVSRLASAISLTCSSLPLPS